VHKLMAATVFADDNDNGKKDSLERAAHLITT
jgi:hypothetical protein